MLLCAGFTELMFRPSPGLSPKNAQSYEVWGGERGFALECFKTHSESQREPPLPAPGMTAQKSLRGEAG